MLRATLTPRLSPSARLRRRFVDEVLPAVERIARRMFWRHRCPGKRADLLQDALLHAWVGYLRLVERGRGDDLPVGGLATIACRRARCGLSIRGVGLKGRRIYRDACDWKTQRRHGFTVESYDHEGDGWRSKLADSRLPVAEAVAFHLDFAAWLGTRAPQERAAIELLGSGERPLHASRRLGVAPSWICKRQVAWRSSWQRFRGGV